MRRHKPVVFILGALIVLAAWATPAQAANPYYAYCVACHPLPLMQAQGVMGVHGGWGPPPGFIEEACMMECHEWTPPEGHSWSPVYPFYWKNPLDPFSYPPGPSVSKQMCEQCHLTALPPLDTMHPHDQIPYLPTATMPPPPVLPLFQGDGVANQDPSMGGLVCSTCHDPHDPSYTALPSGKPSYLRVGDPSGDTAPLCLTCHTDIEPQTIGHDLFIDSKTSSIVFHRFPEFGFIDIEILVRNRGTGNYPGGWINILIDDGIGPTFPVGGTSLPFIPPGGTYLAWVSIPDMLYLGSEVFNFELDPSEMNPTRLNVIARAPYVPPAPQNLSVYQISPDSVDLIWDLPMTPPVTPLTYNVYRNGVKVNPFPLQEWESYYTDTGLAPETPYTYTVEAVNSEGFASLMSNRVGALTGLGFPIRVPQDYPTINDALMAAVPGTTILVAPGTYGEFITVGGGQIAIQGQDANGCILDLSMAGELRLSGFGPNSLSGFTIRGGVVVMSPADTVFQSVFQSAPPASIRGGGFVTNSIFEDIGAPSIRIDLPDEKLTVANSVFMTNWPFDMPFPEEQLYLINNAFPYWTGWQWLPGENNFDDFPFWTPSGPPDRYFIEPLFPFLEGGADVGLPFMGYAPDVGVFEIGLIYTAKAPSNLTASHVPPAIIRLMWSPSPDEDIMSISYNIYRSEFPDFPGIDDEYPIGGTYPGETTFDDTLGIPGTTYYYKVRAFTDVDSEASNIVSAVAGGGAPTAFDDSYGVNEDDNLIVIASGVLLNDSDPEGDPLSAVLVSGPSNAQSFNLNSDGSFDYTPLPDNHGLDSFTYIANDGINNSNVATVTITVSPVNDPPDAVADSYTVDAAFSNHSLNVLLNDGDIDGDPLTISYVWPPDQGGTAINRGDHIDYSQLPFFVGEETFLYEVSDGQGGFAMALVTVTIANDPPTAVDDTYAINEDTLLAVSPPGVLDNDTDPNPNPLTAVLDIPPMHAQSFNLNPDGSFDYSPAAEFSGIDTFTYRAHDGFNFSNPAAVTITVNPVNDLPAADDDAYSVDEDAALNEIAPGVLGNDSDKENDPLSAVLVTGVSSGTLNLNPDGSFDYTPNPDFNGTDSFTYRASDGLSDSNPAAVTITVNPVNDAPTAENDLYVFDEDTNIIVIPPGVLINDVDVDGDPLTATLLFSGPTDGVLNFNPDGSFDYTPNPDFNGVDFFFYVANDGTVNSSMASVTLAVNNVNDPPVANDDITATDEDTQVFVDVLVNDFDIDSEFSISTYSNGAHGQVMKYASTLLVYLPDPDYNGPDSFTYTVKDYALESNTATVSVTVNPVNDAPDAYNRAPVTYEDTPVAVNLIADDVENDPLTYAVTSGPSNGALSGTAPNLTYTPDPDFNGPDSFTYTANDGQADSNVATASITVNAVNDAPVADNQSIATSEDTPLAITLTASDVENDPLTYAVSIGPANGTLSGAAPILTYTPNPDFSGSDSFTFTANDGTVDSNTATVTITVNSANDAPVAVDDSAMTSEDVAVTIPVLGNDYDVDGDILNVISVTDSANGTAVINPDQTVTYTPDGDFYGFDTFEYTVGDGQGGTDTAAVTVDVAAANDAPVAVDDASGTAHADPVTIDVLGNDYDVDGDILNVILVTDPANGTAVINPDQTVTYTPDGDFYGFETFEYTVGDGQGGTDTGIVTIDVATPIMRIASIFMEIRKSGTSVWATASVVVVDELGVPVATAYLSGHWEGLTSDSDSGITDDAGLANFSSDVLKKPNGTFTFVVDSVSKDGYAFDAASSVMSNSIHYPPLPPVCTDGDGDEYSVEGGECGPVDCNDADFLVNPGALEVCDDTIDNDCDGLTDGEDPDCLCTPTETPEASCADSIDNDCDGLTDGEDPDCLCTPTETPEASCDDLIDNDCDGLTDGEDPDCIGCVPTASSEKKLCSDGLDNDCDGLTDCADPDCLRDSSCR